MPLYEYRCTGCGMAFEHLHSRAGDAAPPCPRCGASDAERLLSVFAVSRPSAPAPPGPCGSSDCACRRN